MAPAQRVRDRRAGACRRTLLAGAVQWRFTGTTDAVDESWPDTVDAVAAVTATDGLKGLARQTVAPERRSAPANSPAPASPAWPTMPGGRARAVDVGAVTVRATTLDGPTIDRCAKSVRAEWGWLYVDGAGALVFRQRDAGDTDPHDDGAIHVHRL